MAYAYEHPEQLPSYEKCRELLEKAGTRAKRALLATKTFSTEEMREFIEKYDMNKIYRALSINDLVSSAEEACKKMEWFFLLKNSNNR